MDVILAPAAIADLEQIRLYIGQFNPLAAQRVAGRLLAALQSLADMPERGRPIDASRRELTIQWPYVIRYRITPTHVEILRIRHGARMP